MRIVVVSDTFPPLRTSGAVQIRDLTREMVSQGHDVTLLIPDADLDQAWRLDNLQGVKVLRLRAAKTKDVGYVRRTIGEFLMPYLMRWKLRNSPLKGQSFEGVVWYSPSIFHGPLVKALKNQSDCKSYLIIRDIFPQWALDMEILRKGLVYSFLDAVAKYQYSVADTIGVQTVGNIKYFDSWRGAGDARQLEVLPNWLGKVGTRPSPLRIEKTVLRDRKILVYAGNMGAAQGLDLIIELASQMRDFKEVGFLFVGRGSHVIHLKELANSLNANNVVFHDELDPDEIPDLYSQCTAGIVSLDFRHKSHNIPGKFLTYMQSGLPVLATVNSDNDLVKLIRESNVGGVVDNNCVQELHRECVRLIEIVDKDREIFRRCMELFDNYYSAKKSVKQIVDALGNTAKVMDVS